MMIWSNDLLDYFNNDNDTLHNQDTELYNKNQD